MFTFIESAAFERARSLYLTDDEYGELQQFMLQNPEAGRLVSGSGGVRKLRWARPGGGRRGGLRIIYFVRYRPKEFWMLTMFAKAKVKNVPSHKLRALRKEFEG